MSKSKVDYGQMTEKELEGLHRDLEQERRAISEQLRAVRAELDQRYERKRMVVRLGAMSDADKAALAQALQAEGVGSGEVFGEM